MHELDFRSRFRLATTSALAITISLAIGLMAIRVIHLIYYWPAGLNNDGSELRAALLMGWRFDLKVNACMALLIWPFFLWRETLTQRMIQVWASAYALIAVTNFYYYGFYKIPIDSVIFGVIDDDTAAIFKTILNDFPLFQIALFLVLAIVFFNYAAWHTYRLIQSKLAARPSNRWSWSMSVGLLFITLLIAKGTLKGMALEQDNLTVTSKPFLNHAATNGVIALFDAWDAYHKSLHITDIQEGIRAQGFSSVQTAALAAGITAISDKDIAAALRAHGVNHLNGKNLLFFQMESWSAEPLRYQSPSVDVMGNLASDIHQAVWFDNYDSSSPGTHPALEAILYSSPVTPITTGKYRDVAFDWALPRVLKNAGYDTLFVTSGQSGWRELNRVLITQGFDEVIDAATLKKRYPDAEGGIWGVWDAYMMDYIVERMQQQPANKPLFIYAMTTTNHPPYELPSSYQTIPFDMKQWPGEQSSDQLVANLQTYRYANDELARLLHHFRDHHWLDHSVIAAAGDHNVRTMGLIATAEQQAHRLQVPLMIWGAPAPACPAALHQPASHLDIFPTLFPLLGLNEGYLLSGRNLLDCEQQRHPTSLTFVSLARTPTQLWQLGQPKTLACQPPGTACSWPDKDDERLRARLGLLDWNVRRAVLGR